MLNPAYYSVRDEQGYKVLTLFQFKHSCVTSEIWELFQIVWKQEITPHV